MAVRKLSNAAGTSGYWLDLLGAELDRRGKDTRTPSPTMRVYNDYYLGKHKLEFATEKFQEAFGGLFREFAENVCGVVVNSMVERIGVLGFRLQGETDADSEMRRFWQANNLDAKMPQGFREAAIKGEANIIVGPGPGDVPRITVEDPLETIVLTLNGERIVALKRWYDSTLGRWRAFVYYRDRIEKFWAANAAVGTAAPLTISAWSPQDDVEGDPQTLTHNLGAVPMVPLPNGPDIHDTGTSELAEVVPIQDAINKFVADMIVASEFQSFRQRYLVGLDIPIDPNTGSPIGNYQAAVSRFLFFNKSTDADPNDKTEIGEFGQVDLGPLIDAVKQRLQMIGTIKRIPIHYLISQQGNPPSGESLAASETGLVAKAVDRQRDWTGSLKEVFRLAYLIAGNEERAAAIPILGEVLWRDPRFRTETEHVDALVKLRALGIPDEFLWEQKGYTQEEIDRIKLLRRAQAAEAALLGDPFGGFTQPARPTVVPPAEDQAA